MSKRLRCLFVSPEPLTQRSGMQSLIAISSFSEIDIIAPEGSDLKEYKTNVRIISTYKWNNINIFKRFTNIIFYGRPRFVNIKDVKNRIDWSCYDFAFFEFPWNYLLMEEAKKNKIKVFCRFHNIESLVLKKQVIKERKIGYFLMYLRCAIAEKRAIFAADGLIFLKKEDEYFYQDKYISIKNKRCIIPISIMNHKRFLTPKNNKNIIFAAQLSYGPNREGLIWLLDTVWEAIAKMGFTLFIAGGNADKKIRETLRRVPNIKTFYDPTENEMEYLYGKASFSIAPIFWGSGMKVKIAQSLARGIVPIGTPEAFSGYEVQNKKDCFVFKNEKDLYEVFCRINKMTLQEKENMSKSARELYEKKYEMNICINAYKKFILETINDGKAP
jgi:glycosyltransferase involved in cell wall biosynthesis